MLAVGQFEDTFVLAILLGERMKLRPACEFHITDQKGVCFGQLRHFITCVCVTTWAHEASELEAWWHV